jgi:hypothetical protein
MDPESHPINGPYYHYRKQGNVHQPKINEYMFLAEEYN